MRRLWRPRTDDQVDHPMSTNITTSTDISTEKSAASTGCLESNRDEAEIVPLQPDRDAADDATVERIAEQIDQRWADDESDWAVAFLLDRVEQQAAN
jgi:hypothetical protein